MKFELMPAIPVIAGDDIAYGVVCLQLLDSSLEVRHFVKGKIYWKVLLTNIRLILKSDVSQSIIILLCGIYI